MVDFVVILLFLYLTDRSFPVIAKLYGIGLFPLTDERQVREFDRSYGYVKLPRTLLLVASAIAFSSSSWGPVDRDLSLIAGIATSVLFSASAVADLMIARRASLKVDPQ